AVQDRERASFERRRQRTLVPYAQAKERRFVIDWQAVSPPRPAFTGTRVLADIPLTEIVPYIDWSPFFMAWELNGKYPAIFNDPKVGKVARELFADASQLLERIVANRLLQARAVYGFFPAAAEDDDIVVYVDESRIKERLRF